MQKIDKTRSLTPGDDRSRAWKAISLYTGASLSDLVIFDMETSGTFCQCFLPLSDRCTLVRHPQKRDKNVSMVCR